MYLYVMYCNACNTNASVVCEIKINLNLLTDDIDMMMKSTKKHIHTDSVDSVSV